MLRIYQIYMLILQNIVNLDRKISENLKFFRPFNNLQFIIQLDLLMNHNIRTEKSLSSQTQRSICAGALASLLTQPFEVLKTNMIDSPSLYMR